MEKQLLSTEEAATYLGVKQQTLRLWRKKGTVRIPVVRIGRLVKYELKDLDDLIAKSKEAVEQP